MCLLVRVHAGGTSVLIIRAPSHEYCCLLLDCKQAFEGSGEVEFHQGLSTICGGYDSAEGREGAGWWGEVETANCAAPVLASRLTFTF